MSAKRKLRRKIETNFIKTGVMPLQPGVEYTPEELLYMGHTDLYMEYLEATKDLNMENGVRFEYDLSDKLLNELGIKGERIK